ncbi:uncharacterized protein EI90DRAFT_3013891 [Cantharellus anzutake]|uniref:uncharacterized protein n=1 Tax=Cantharellus anzutake TaxID=1750568 RepID=UPI00190812CD|nr:uncharacterized protein EI90DRAFT_3013891 [Cantharellus anzutake]KAF8336906.1 hypothetical protein EI90DRAFT_3013891 [Cantharellus anzutake]
MLPNHSQRPLASEVIAFAIKPNRLESFYQSLTRYQNPHWTGGLAHGDVIKLCWLFHTSGPVWRAQAGHELENFTSGRRVTSSIWKVSDSLESGEINGELVWMSVVLAGVEQCVLLSSANHSRLDVIMRDSVERDAPSWTGLPTLSPASAVGCQQGRGGCGRFAIERDDRVQGCVCAEPTKGVRVLRVAAADGVRSQGLDHE